jgi:hypothetical protein
MKKHTSTVLAAFILALEMMALNAWAQNPTPFINEISPVAAVPGASAFTLTVDGTGFASGAVVNWTVGTTTTPLATTFVSATQVTATVPASLVATAATASVTVVNPDAAPLEGTSNIEFFQITTPTSSVAFTTASSPGTGQYPHSVAVGDFNGDGKLDLAVVNECGNDPDCGSPGTVSILLGNGNGTFNLASGPPITVGFGPESVAVGDFNGDGKLDLAVVNWSDDNVSILLGNGDGTFTPASTPTVSVGSDPYSLAVGDFNGDGKLDLAVVNFGDNTVSILLGNGDGTFTPASTPTVSVAEDPRAVAVGDFNGDGKLDLAVVNQCGNDPYCGSPGTVSILLGNGDGTFTAAPSPNVSPYASWIAVGDFNGDGKLDLAVTSWNNNTMYILLGNGNGTFTPASGSPITVSFAPESVAVGDFNGDGKLDLAVANECGSDPTCSSPGNVAILLGNGDGTFTAAPSPSVGLVPLSLAVGDFNGDGRLDVASANYDSNTVSILVQPPAPEPGVPPSLAFGNQNLGTHNTLPLTITDTGTAALNITGATLSGTNSADFAAALNTCSSAVSPGGSCAINVTFTPSIAGAESATLTVDDNGGTGAQTVSLSGAGTVAVASLSPSSLSFAGQAVGTTSAAQTVTLMNTGGAPLAITGVTVSAGFAESNTCGSSLAAGGKCTISVTFTPAATGSFTGTLSVIDNSNGVAGSTQTVSLSGTGLAGFSITPTPSTETVTRGILGAFILTLKSLDGFKGAVTLSCSGGPAGSYCADLPATVNLNGTVYAISGILFPKTAAAGTYTITFTGTSGAISEDATATFIVK